MPVPISAVQNVSVFTMGCVMIMEMINLHGINVTMLMMIAVMMEMKSLPEATLYDQSLLNCL